MTKRWLALALVLTLLVTCFTGAMAAEVTPKGMEPIVTFVPKTAVINASLSDSFTMEELGTFYLDGKAVTTAAESAVLATEIGSIVGASATSIQNGKLYASFTPEQTLSNGASTKTLKFGTISNSTYDFTEISGKAIVDVKVYIPVTSVALDKKTLTFDGKGSEQTLTATVTPDNGADREVTWTSTNEKVATVVDGVVTAVDAGTATITASVKNGKQASCVVTVNAVAPTTVSISGNLSIQVDETTQLSAAITAPANATSTTFTWKSGNTDVATVNADGVVTGLAAGTVRITATAANGKSNSVDVVVSTITNRQLAAPTFSLAAGTYEKEQTLTLTSNTVGAKIYYTLGEGDVYPADPTEQTGILYTGPITLNQNKKYVFSVRAFKDGYTPSATAAGTGAGHAYFSIDIVPTEIKLSQTAVTVNGKSEVQLTAEVVPANANVGPIVWSVDDVTHAFVDQNGKVSLDGTGGTVVVSAKTQRGVAVGSSTLPDSYFVQEKTCTITVKEVPVQSITAKPASITVPVGQKAKLEGVLSPANATASTIVYTSTNRLIANIQNTSEGVYVVGVSQGSAIITVRVGNKQTTCQVTVTEREDMLAAPIFSEPSGTKFTKPAKVEITHLNEALLNTFLRVYYTDDGTTPTAASTLYTDAIDIPANKTTTFKAFVRNTLTGAESAVTTVTYTSEIAVTGVSLSGPSVIAGSASINLYATVLPNVAPNVAFNKEVTFASSNPAILTVAPIEGDPSGVKVTGVAPGAATVTVTTKDGAKTDSMLITVTKVDVTSVAIEAPAATLKAGDMMQLEAVLNGGTTSPTNKKVTWSSSDNAIATVDANGKVTGIAAGNVTITVVTADGAKTATKALTITANDYVVSEIKVSLPTGTYHEEKTVELTTATVGAKIYYTLDGSAPSASSTAYPEGGIKLSKDAKLRAIAVKDAYQSAYTSLYEYKFEIYVTKVELDKTVVTAIKGDKVQLTATVTPSIATEQGITWTSETPDVATVDNNGLVTTLKVGTAKITAKTKDANSTADPAVCAITVEDVPVTNVAVIPSTATMNIGDTKTLVANVLPTDLESKAATWTSSDSTIATVGKNNGVVTALKAGTVTITATVGGVKGTSTITVVADPTVLPVQPEVLPVFEPTVKNFTAVENTSLSKVIGKFEPQNGETWEQIKYYYTVGITASGLPDGAVFDVDADGVVTLNIPDVKAAGEKPFIYTWRLTWRSNRGRVPGVLDASGRAISGNKLIVTKEPSKDEKAVSDAKDAISKQSIVINMADAKTEAEAKAALLAELNKAIASTGIVLTADDITITDFVAATDTTDGSFKFTVKLKSGDVTDTVSGTAKINHVPATAKLTADSATKYFVNPKGRWVFALADRTVQFKVDGYTVTNWKSSKPKVVSIDSNGVATLKKVGTGVKISAKLSNGQTLNQVINVQKIASEIKLQYKNAKGKWVDFSESNPMTVGVKKKFLTRIVSVTPTGAKTLDPKWSMGDTAIASRGGKGYINGVAAGETTVTVTLYNGVTVTGKVIVSASKGLEDEGLDINAPEDDYEEALVDVEEVEEINEVGEPEEAAEAEVEAE